MTMKRDEAMTRQDILVIALHHMIAMSSRHSGRSVKDEARLFLRRVKRLDGRSRKARALKDAVARRMSFVSE